MQVFLNKYRSGKRVFPPSNISTEQSDVSEKATEKQPVGSPSKDTLHKKSGTNSSTDFSIFLNSSGSKKDDLVANDKKNIENIKKQEASRLLKEGEDKNGRTKDLMKKINALKNRKTGGDNK